MTRNWSSLPAKLASGGLRENAAIAYSRYLSLRRKIWRDSYPRSLIPIKRRKARIVLNNTAFTFWTAAAERNPAFQNLYFPSTKFAAPEITVNGARNPPCDKIPAPSDSLDQLITSTREFGVGLLEGFLPEADYRDALEEFSMLRYSEPVRVGDGVVFRTHGTSADFRALFDVAIYQISQELFGRGVSTPRSSYIERVELTGIDRNDPNTIPHIDRFLPCIKIFYFPHAIKSEDQSPFCFVPGSHIVDDDYRKAVRESFERLSIDDRPHVINARSELIEWPALTVGNSLVVAYTNGIHRRRGFGPTALPGSFRESACFMFYDSYTRKNLISNFLTQVVTDSFGFVHLPKRRSTVGANKAPLKLRSQSESG